MRRTADVTLRLRTAPLLPHRTWLPTHVRSVMNASGHDHNLRRTLTTSASASSSSKKSSQEATGSEDEDYTKLARRPALEQQLQRLEQTAEPVTPRQLTNLLRALIVGKHRDNMDELEPRVLDLHARVHGGTQFDGSALLAALSYMGHLPASFAEYERLKRDGVQLFELNYGYLVEVASAKGDLDRAFTVVDLLREDRHRLVEGRLSTFVFNRLLLACGRNNALDMSSRVIQYLVDEGLRPTPTTFASFIDACAMTSDLHRGLSILRHMKSTLNLSPERYQLDARYFTSLIPACRDPEDFDRVVAEMIREGVEPTENVMEAFIRDCATNGGLSRALGMFKEFRLFCETRSHDRQRKLRQRLQREAEAGASEQRLRALLDEQQQKQRLVVHKPSLSPLF